MLDLSLCLMTGGAAALGAIAAQLRGPICWNWEGHVGDLRRRLSSLPRRAPPTIRRAAGMALLASLLAGGALAAYAAAPSAARAPTALERLPGEVAGVVGSGDKLSLRLTGSDGMRTVAVGQVVTDGWRLSGLTPTSATLTKAGQNRLVGLNPSGGAGSAPAAAAPSRVVVQGGDNSVGQQMAAMLARGVTVDQAAGLMVQIGRDTAAADMPVYRTQYNNAMVAAGQRLGALSAEQTQRYFELSNRIEARKAAIRQGAAPAVPFFSDDLSLGAQLIDASLGADAAEYNAYLQALNGDRLAAERNAVIARPLTGPSTYVVAAGADPRRVEADLGVDLRGTWISTPAADGGQTYTRVAAIVGPIARTEIQAALRDADAIAKGADPARLSLTPAGAAALMDTVPASVRAALGK